MLRTKFIGTVLVLILGVNLGAWTLSVATSSAPSVGSISVPVTPSAIDARSQAASVVASQSAEMSGKVIDVTNAANTASSTAASTSTPQYY